MNVLVFNCGSSSLKYKLIDMKTQKELTGGEAQRVGPKTAEPSRILYRMDGKEQTLYADMPNHEAAFSEVMNLISRDEKLKPGAIGHRMVHGGAQFKNPTLLNASVLADLEKTKALAPIHNPPAIALIEASLRLYPHLPQVAVFDTAYHATMPARAYTYPIPRTLADRLSIRKYGFHGTSHQFVAREAADFLGIPLSEFNAVSCHLGSGGASLCAISRGQSIDNTMGFSPLQGLVMSTRCGDLDPSLALQLVALNNGNIANVEGMLNKKSGVLGLSGISADLRDVLERLRSTDSATPRLELAAQVYLWRLKKYLGAYLAAVGNAHAVIFTDTIGELSPAVRWRVCADMDCFGLALDFEKNNQAASYPADISAEGSPVRALVVATNEEIAIARQTYQTCA